MIAYLSKNPIRVSESGDLLICDESFLHHYGEPITQGEMDAINTFVGTRVLKKRWFWQQAMTRAEAVDILKKL